MRDADEKTRRAKYPTVSLLWSRPTFPHRQPFLQTTIRIKFSDRSQLEKTFPSTDKIRAVYAFVRDSLREDVRSIKFVLSMIPVFISWN